MDGQTLGALLRRAGVTQEELAQTTGRSRVWVTAQVAGRMKLSDRLQKAAADRLRERALELERIAADCAKAGGAEGVSP